MTEHSSFSKKHIELRVTLQAGSFNGGNQKIITELPIKVGIEKTGPPDFCKASVEVRGLRYEDMDRLSTLAFKPLASDDNMIEILVGDKQDGMAMAFQGTVTQASADFNPAPDVVFKMEAMAGYYGAITAQSPTAVQGSQSAASFIAMQAQKVGLSFQNDGVDTQLNNAIFNGSPVAQARSAATQIGAELIIDDGAMILMPEGGAGESAGGGRGNAVLLNKSTGLLGYPTITNEGLELKALYNPAFRLAGLIKLESIVPKASGIWRITKLSHELAAFDPDGGPWESHLTVMEQASGK